MILKRRGDFTSFPAPMLGLALMLSACMVFNRERAAWQGGSDDAVEKHRRWKKSLPRCFPWQRGVREDWPESGPITKLRGVLYPDGWMCTLMECGGGCCNGCSTHLRFIPRAEVIRKGVKGRGSLVYLPGKSSPLGYSAMDCETNAIDEMPLLEVVVSGQWEDEKERTIVDAEMCILGEVPPESVRGPTPPAGH